MAGLDLRMSPTLSQGVQATQIISQALEAAAQQEIASEAPQAAPGSLPLPAGIGGTPINTKGPADYTLPDITVTASKHMPGVAEALTAAEAHQDIVQQGMESVTKTYNILTQTLPAWVESTKQGYIPGTQDTPESIRQKRIAALQAQTATQGVANSADFSAMQNSLAQIITATTREQLALIDKIDKANQVSFLDDPGQAIYNMFSVPWDQERLDLLNKKLELASGASTKLNSAIQSASTTFDKISDKVTTASLNSEVAAAKSEIDRQYLHAQMIAAQTSATAVAQVTQMSAQQAAAANSLMHIYGSDEQRRHAADIAKQAREGITKALGEERLAEGVIHTINKALAAEGRAQISAADFPRIKFELMHGTAAQKARWGALAEAGTVLEATGDYNHGVDIASRLRYQHLLGIKYSENSIQGAVVRLQQDIMRGLDPTGKLKEADLAPQAEKIFAEKFREWETYKKGDSTNPLRPISYKSAMHDAAITANPVWSGLIVPTLTDETMLGLEIDMKDIIKRGAAAIIAGQARPVDVVNLITTIANKTVLYHNTEGQLARVSGLTQRDLKTKIEYDGKRNTVDLRDSVSVMKALDGFIRAAAPTHIPGTGFR